MFRLRNFGWLRHRRSVQIACAALIAAVAAAGVVQAANNSVQGAPKKEEGGYDTDATNAILIEASSGSILFEKNADQLTAPSTMQKLVTLEVVLNAIQKGELKLSDDYKVSTNAWRKGGAPSIGPKMFAAINSRILIDDLLRGVMITNGNDACIVLAEGMSGSEQAFTERMTKRARELGLTQATFGNATGMPDPNNKMTVREIAKVARHIVLNYPEQYQIFKEREFTWSRVKQQNLNPLLASMTSADGFMAGATKDSGYGMVGSAFQNGQRLIVVVNGVDDPDDRVTEAKKLLEWGFRNFETRTLFAPKQLVGYARVFGGETRSVALNSTTPITVMVQRNGADKLLARIVYNGPLPAPVEPGRPVGVLRVMRNNQIAVEAPLETMESVGVGSTTRRAVDGVSELVGGFFRSSVGKL